jgi:hypothetical protein
LFLSARIAQLISLTLILTVISSELSRYAYGEFSYTISLEHEAEETSDTESKTELVDQSDELLFTNSINEHYPYTLYLNYTLCPPTQKPAFDVCKVELDPPELSIS